MGITRREALSGLAMATAATMAGPVFGASVEEFYRGKTLTLVVSAPAGSPTDVVARQFARFFPKHLPGAPNAIVMNIVGAGGMVAAASLQTRQPADGTVIGFLQRNNLYTSLLDPAQSAFDPREVRWLGSIDKVFYCIVAMTRSGVTTGEELFSKRLIIGATGFSNENRTLPAMLNQYLGTDMAIVPGYSDRGEVYLAMERQEIDGWASTVDGLTQGEPARMLEDGSMKVLLHLAWESHPDYPDVPNLSSHVDTPEVHELFDFFLAPFEAGRPIAVPKNVPEDRLEALRAAFADTLVDEEFKAALRTQGYPTDPIDGTAVETIISELYDTPAPLLETLRKLVTS
ncbi:Bug family tripartite tricarboxylate transporter substrate binding protein [Paenirhodobacter populi]|uniref:Bug family tripartite tricarboxylate transporter substrate binding protein n=1 Tax=Paenirhodobacter populi TaxID=2306993 RepID=UPI0013E3650E|nr:hypothetical protein [Sinirhodobacter populi]